MCGEENKARSRGGALAVLLSSVSNPGVRTAPTFNADMFFRAPGEPDRDEAFQVIISPTNENTFIGSWIYVFISTTGDLTTKIEDCKLWHQFTSLRQDATKGHFITDLTGPLSLRVGDNGIMGRRVTLCSAPIPSPQNIIAEGIVGHNYLTPQQIERFKEVPF